MQLPDTDNIDYQYAFKQGYRMAVDGKRVTSMPSKVRRDMMMREYFQQGWEQAIEDMSLNYQIQNKPNWRTRFIWFAFMVLGGIATASLMIKNIESDIAEQQARLEVKPSKSDTQKLPDSKPSPDTNLAKSSPANIANSSSSLPTLSLLSNQQRKDLELNKQQQAVDAPLSLDPIIKSSITVKQAVLSENIENREPISPLSNRVPKYIRKLAFFTEIENANGQTIYHRWRTNNQILATIALPIGSNKFKTWSTKKLSSAWLGQWYIEVLDSNKNVIYRLSFNYGGKP
ncbi:DUF2914 domain-containing protein [Thiomicrorhabdus sp. Milos-T2]|uniref:DUF2914 domain-containing protein n=1 Tax=Thiomicrorhabdus sp. Milos-T2 TaxID=90814 RepID=UPI0004940A86|nr:DUF2914 domain-containing protein [Thiomicrorhabdus sp. Milos-T2]